MPYPLTYDRFIFTAAGGRRVSPSQVSQFVPAKQWQRGATELVNLQKHGQI
jgi:hypothetical protein